MKQTNKELIYSIYKENQEGISITELSKKYNISTVTIYFWFNNFELKSKKGLCSSKLYKSKWDEDFFENINSEEKAYFLGLLFADGYIRLSISCGKYESKRLGIKLQSQDENLIIKFRDCLKANHYKIRKEKNLCSGTAGIEVTSTKLVDDLINLGIKYKKSSQELNIPNLENDLYKHFIRGFIDGDGWISISKKDRVQIGCCCTSLVFLNQIKNILSLYNIRTSIYSRDNSKIKKHYKILYTLLIADNKSMLNFLEMIYNNSTMQLDRKYDKYIHANTVLNSKIKKLESV